MHPCPMVCVMQREDSLQQGLLASKGCVSLQMLLVRISSSEA